MIVFLWFTQFMIIIHAITFEFHLSLSCFTSLLSLQGSFLDRQRILLDLSCFLHSHFFKEAGAIVYHNDFTLEEHIFTLNQKANQTLNTLSRTSQHLSQRKKPILLKTIIS